jgi:prepilin-type N-terminal cleavage/methylation domain-containing protein
MARSHRDRRPRAGRRSFRRGGFTLIELLIVVFIVSLLASIIIVKMSNMLGTGRAETLSATVSHVRELIGYHAALVGEPKSAAGFPIDVNPAWFDRGVLPTHTWTQRPMIVESIDGDPAAFYPAVKVFDDDDDAAATAWYNAANGAFCVLVGDDAADDAEVIELFNMANVASVTSLDQTGR